MKTITREELLRYAIDGLEREEEKIWDMYPNEISVIEFKKRMTELLKMHEELSFELAISYQMDAVIWHAKKYGIPIHPDESTGRMMIGEKQ